MRRMIELSDGWRLKHIDPEGPDVATLLREATQPDASWLPCDIPSQVHEILLAHGRIPDPHIGKNAAKVTWIGWQDWAYSCAFPTPDTGDGPAFLRFKGLDTLATAYLNGQRLGDYDNMFREWVHDVRHLLAPTGEENILLVHFHSVNRAIEAIDQPPEHVAAIRKNKYIRKSAQDFGAYLGAYPDAVKVGIFDRVLLDIPDQAWIDDVWVRTDLSPQMEAAAVLVDVATSGEAGGLRWSLGDPSGTTIAQGNADSSNGTIEIPIDEPQLWWPHTHGKPNLYTLDVALTLDGQTVDERRIAVGIRDVRLVIQDPVSLEPRFKFMVNGRPIFLQGAGLAPIEGMTYCWQPDRAARLLDLSEHGRMNCIRVWGGGAIPDDEFYEECDRRGILIWQDFIFGYGMYPDDNPAFNENVRLEVEGIVRRLRNHPSILIWVGGNENHMGFDFVVGGNPTLGRNLFEGVMAEACARVDPTRVYHPSSPFGGPLPNWPLEGDWHDYTTVTFSHQASVPLFASEIGRASAMPMKSMRRFMSEDELWPPAHDPRIRKPGQPAWPPMWQYRSVGGSWEKVGAVEEFLDPTTPAEMIRVLGTAHGEYLRRRVERERRGVPDGAPDGHRRCWGNLIWRLNDSWPILYWSAIDYYLEPKIAYYFLRRAYAPVLLSFERTPDEINVWVTNDSNQTVHGELCVRRARFDGAIRGGICAEVEIAPGQSTRCLSTVPLGTISLRHEFLLARIGDLSATTVLMGERFLNLPEARLEVARNGRSVRIGTDAYARQVMLETDQYGVVFDDNFFDLPPGEIRVVQVVGPGDVDMEAIRVTCVNGQ